MREPNLNTKRVDSAPYHLKADAPVDMWIDPADVESGALDQIRNVATLKWTHKIAVMPDVHYGYGAPIGFNWHKRPVEEAVSSPVWDSFSAVTGRAQDLRAKAVAPWPTMYATRGGHKRMQRRTGE